MKRGRFVVAKAGGLWVGKGEDYGWEKGRVMVGRGGVMVRKGEGFWVGIGRGLWVGKG